MSNVGAYIELNPGEGLPLDSSHWWAEAAYLGKTPEGLQVSWDPTSPEPPENAQVYLVWEPRVYAVWEGVTETEHGGEVTNIEQGGGENGEDREDADGGNLVERDEAVSTESDLGSGEGGAGDGDVPAAGTGGEAEAVE